MPEVNPLGGNQEAAKPERVDCPRGGRDQSEIKERAVRVRRFLGLEAASPAEALDSLPETWIVGTPQEVIDRLAVLSSLGISRIMLWPPLHDDLEMVELIGREVLPRFTRDWSRSRRAHDQGVDWSPDYFSPAAAEPPSSSTALSLAWVSRLFR